MQFELGANSWLTNRITCAGFRNSGPLGGQLIQTRIRARIPIPDPIAGFDRFGLRLQSDYSRLKIVIDQQRFCNRFSKIEPAVELFLRPRPRSDEHGHGNSEIFFFFEKKFCSLKKLRRKVELEIQTLQRRFIGQERLKWKTSEFGRLWVSLPFPAFVMFSIWDSDMDLGDSTSPESIFSVPRLHYGVR